MLCNQGKFPTQMSGAQRDWLMGLYFLEGRMNAYSISTLAIALLSVKNKDNDRTLQRRNVIKVVLQRLTTWWIVM